MLKSKGKSVLLITGFLILILDARTALTGANSGIQLCLYTVIPSLFPFIFLSSALVNELSGKKIGILRKIGTFLGMPPGSEGFLLAGFLGGYPTGAACIAASYRAGQIPKQQAEQLLCFCSNAGPAFIFGIAGALFSPTAAWVLWGIHILSAVLTALSMSSVDQSPVQTYHSTPFSVTAALMHTIRVMASVCGWVILFRILIVFCDRWFLWLLPTPLQALFSGILELSNGCCNLGSIPSLPIRFILFSLFIAFGGICVMMQTVTAVAPLSIRPYVVGKFMQSVLSILLSIMASPILFGWDAFAYAHFLWIASAIAIVLTICLCVKKTVAFPNTMIYNG